MLCDVAMSGDADLLSRVVVARVALLLIVVSVLSCQSLTSAERRLVNDPTPTAGTLLRSAPVCDGDGRPAVISCPANTRIVLANVTCAPGAQCQPDVVRRRLVTAKCHGARSCHVTGDASDAGRRRDEDDCRYNDVIVNYFCATRPSTKVHRSTPTANRAVLMQLAAMTPTVRRRRSSDPAPDGSASDADGDGSRRPEPKRGAVTSADDDRRTSAAKHDNGGSDATDGSLVVDWAWTVLFIKENRERLALYSMLGVAIGSVCLLLLAVFFLLVVRPNRRRRLRVATDDTQSSSDAAVKQAPLTVAATQTTLESAALLPSVDVPDHSTTTTIAPQQHSSTTTTDNGISGALRLDSTTTGSTLLRSSSSTEAAAGPSPSPTAGPTTAADSPFSQPLMATDDPMETDWSAYGTYRRSVGGSYYSNPYRHDAWRTSLRRSTRK